MIIYAVNINSGGGKVLLDRLLTHNPFGQTSAAFLDTRYNPPAVFKGDKFYFIPRKRLQAETELHQYIEQKSKDNEILFFGNLPPFRKSKLKSYLYLQNCYLTRQVPLPQDSLGEKLRNLVESWILKLFYKNVDEIWVQTEWMKAVTQNYLPQAKIQIKPFLPNLPEAKPQLQKKYKFIYVGSLSINKGLATFLTALNELDSLLKTKIEVAIILNNSRAAAENIKNQTAHLKNIAALVTSDVTREQLFKIYETSEYLVATSLYESFYLPLYEAKHFGCKIIASKDAAYITAIKDSEEVFYYSDKTLNLAAY